METKQILKYRRGSDLWLCSECDAENSMAYSRCAVCDSARSPSAVVLKQWSEADEIPLAPPRTDAGAYRSATSSSSSGSIFKDHDGGRYAPPEEKKGGSGVIWVIVGIVAIILIIFLAYQASAAEPVENDLPECESIAYEAVEEPCEYDGLISEISLRDSGRYEK